MTPRRATRPRRAAAGVAAAGLGAVLSMLSAMGEPAGATEVTAHYRAYWAGLPAGEIRLTLHEDPAGYRDEIAISTEGLPHLVTRFRGVATSEGRLAAALPQPARYDAHYDLRKQRDHRLSLRFAGSAGALLAVRGPDDSSGKSPLADRFRTNVLDPLSALSAIRGELRRGNRGAFRVPVYDDARRFDVVARVLPKEPGDRVLHLALTLAPIAGFKGKTSDDGDPDDAPRPVALTVSDDGLLLPLSMKVSLYYLPLVVELTRWCAAASCG